MFSRGFSVLSSAWPTNFQDRLVVTASIFLHIIMHAVALWYAVLFRSGSWNSFHESASHTPRRRVKLACKQRVRVSSTEIILRCSKSSYQLFNYYMVWFTTPDICSHLSSGSWNLFHESASHSRRRCVKLACKQRVRESSQEIFLLCSKSLYQFFNC